MIKSAFISDLFARQLFFIRAEVKVFGRGSNEASASASLFAFFLPLSSLCFFCPCSLLAAIVSEIVKSPAENALKREKNERERYKTEEEEEKRSKIIFRLCAQPPQRRFRRGIDLRKGRFGIWNNFL
jgi:hypothetical protein